MLCSHPNPCARVLREGDTSLLATHCLLFGWFHEAQFRRLIILAVTLLAFVAPSRSHADETRRPQWRASASDCRMRIVSHQRRPEESGQPESDRIRVITERGSFAYVQLAISPLSVINELEISLPFLSDQAGQQVVARIVLPRSIDPKTGQPLTVDIGGMTYEKPNSWQKLRLPNLALELEKRVRVLRSEFGPEVDGREAFVDRLFVNVYTPNRASTALLADPVTQGAVPHGRTLLPNPDAKGVSAILPVSATMRLDQPSSEFHMEGDLLLVDGHPFFVRGIQEQGESWSHLKELGFNTLLLSNPVTSKQIRIAEQLGLWLIAPPPATWNGGNLSSAHRRVIAWNLGQRLTNRDIETFRNQVKEVRQHDNLIRRPIVCNADTDLATFDSSADVLLHFREPIGIDLPIEQYQQWLQSRESLAHTGTAHWAMIQTQPLSELVDQAAAFGFNGESLRLQSDQIETLVVSAIASGTRGVIFASRNRLDVDSANARFRAAALRRVNLQLDLLAPWIAGGTKYDPNSANAISANDASDDSPSVHSPSAVLRTDRSWLAIPPIHNPNNLRQHSVSTLSIAGIPPSVEVLEFDSKGLNRLVHRRTPNGIRLENNDATKMVLMTQDRFVVQHTHRKMMEHAPVRTVLNRQLAVDLWERTEQVLRDRHRSKERLRPVLALLRESEKAIATGDYVTADERTDAAFTVIRDVRAQLQREDASQVAALPWHGQIDAFGWTVPETFAKPAHEYLPGNDFESLPQLREQGWRNFTAAPDWLETNVELVAHESAASAPHASPVGGNHFLRLETRIAPAKTLAASVSKVAETLERVPLWISSPEIPIEPGSRVLIRGWVRQTEALTHCQEGVMIFESAGGPRLGFHVKPSDDWQRFEMVRTVPTDSLRLTIAVTGVGQVDLDNFSIVRLDKSNRKTRLPATSP